MKDHYVILDRAVEKIYNRLEEFKVRRSGWSQWAAEGIIIHGDI